MSYLTLITTDSIHGKPMGNNASAAEFSFLLYEEWEEIFFTVLKCPDYVWDHENENQEQGEVKRKKAFQKAIPDYPFLARIDDVYQDVFFTVDELPFLKLECEKVADSTEKQQALSGLSKLITKCNEAIKFELGLKLRAN